MALAAYSISTLVGTSTGQKSSYQPLETLGVASRNGEMGADGETEAIAPHRLLFDDVDNCSGLVVARRSKLYGRLRAAQAILRQFVTK